MTDLELAEFLGFADDKRWPRAIAKLDPKRRAAYERLAEISKAIDLYEKGLGPKPPKVILCYDHSGKDE